jgi:hypothetical protein
VTITVILLNLFLLLVVGWLQCINRHLTSSVLAPLSVHALIELIIIHLTGNTSSSDLVFVISSNILLQLTGTSPC